MKMIKLRKMKMKMIKLRKI